ncbi:hypothetical protein B0H17DRAFT_1209374 [Mycena rosella]|uniref:Uncharacterized protein n=1 Tax=Mycena rosella TaxID=1033263 RepID=A0AAD7CZZ1_MYCRO|nr:hypothetical protein B0H17DRAFT_1209374 [Mycena rosella]
MRAPPGGRSPRAPRPPRAPHPRPRRLPSHANARAVPRIAALFPAPRAAVLVLACVRPSCGSASSLERVVLQGGSSVLNGELRVVEVEEVANAASEKLDTFALKTGFDLSELIASSPHLPVLSSSRTPPLPPSFPAAGAFEGAFLRPL